MLRIVSRSIRHKLALTVLATTLAALLVTGAALVIYDLRAYREAGFNDLLTQAEIIGRASAAALAFDDAKAATENLALLKAKPKIAAAAIYNAKGKLFSTYMRHEQDLKLPGLPESEGTHLDGGAFVVFKRVVENNEILGTVYIRADYEAGVRLLDYLGIFGAVAVLSLIIALLISGWLQNALTQPILEIAALTRQVVQQRDFSLRARKITRDEIGELADAFNDMLAEIGRRAEALEQSNRFLEREMAERQHADAEVRKLNEELEQRVAERTAQLRESEERHRAVVDTAVDAIIVIDQRGAIQRFNPGAERMFGYAEAEVVQKNVSLLMPSPYRDEHDAYLERYRATGEKRVIGTGREVTGRRRDGTEFSAYLAVGEVRVGDGRMFTGIIRDITEAKQAAERQAHLVSSLEAANKELESFSYSVSHDLRAPLRAVVGFSKILVEDHAGQIDPEALRKLNVIQSEAHRMGQLIDDLLAFSRLGRKAMNVVELDMTELARATYAGMNGTLGADKVELRIAALPKAKGDRVLLGQVWANLLSNAVKFSSKQGNPLVEVSAISDEKEHIYFVRDNGAGFDPRYQSKLFGVFQRLHSSNEFPGTGVGLALVQRIVVRHGGRVWADGRPGEGATFYFTLPKEDFHGAV